MTTGPTPPEPTAPPVPLQWDMETATVPANGIEIIKSATEPERQAVATQLNLVSCDALTATYRVRRLAGDRYGVRGKLTADVVQACVVSLAPVLETLSATFSVEFRPAEEVAALGGVIDLDDEIDIEPIEAHRMAVGRVVFEELAAAINPYPRRPGAEFTPSEVDTAASAAAVNPFAILAKLKTSKPPTRA